MNNLEFLRHYRIFSYAIFDLSLSFLGMFLLSGLLSKLFRRVKISIPKINWIYLTLPIGIIIHILVGTMTPMTKNFIDLNFYEMKFAC